MDLSPAEAALIDLMRSVGDVTFHVGLTSIDGIATLNVVAEGVSVSGIGPTFDDAFANAYQLPEPPPQTTKAPRFAIVAGIDHGAAQR